MFSDEDKVLIKCLRESKWYGAKRLLTMFPDRLWNPSGIQKLIGKTDEKAARIVVRAVVDRALPTAARRLKRLKNSHRVRKESPTATVHNDKLHAKPVYPLLPLTLSSGRT